MFRMVAAGLLKPRISARYDLRNVGRALEAVENRMVTGKSVIVSDLGA